jgi:molecular chaperone GrpE
MTSDKSKNKKALGADLQGDGEPSVEDFIKQLEAKEKDLDISSELVIEVEEADFDDMNIPDFILSELDINASGTGTSAAAVVVPAEQSVKLQTEVRELKEKVTALITERAELQGKSLRQMNDFENLKNRMERERSETFNSQLANLATQMLPVLDNLNRALDFASAMPDEKRLEIQEFFDGIVLVNQQVNDVFAGMGVQPITAVGEEFDPNIHEAVAADESGEHVSNTITAEFLRGYRIGHRVIRHSMVKVSKPRAGQMEAQPENGGELGPELELEVQPLQLEISVIETEEEIIVDANGE